MPVLVIEHLERLSKWVWLEYRHIARYWKGNLLFTNVKSKAERKRLRVLGRVTEKSVAELNLSNAVVLDPQAEKELTPEEARSFEYFIIGGICGDYPPRGRTKELITSRLRFPARNLGKVQLTTDSAAIVLKKILEGKRLEEIEIINGVELDMGFAVLELPFGFVAENGKPLIAPGLIEHLRMKRKI